ncbi:MAG: hypothetical protein HZB26_18625 [Candidatus Hydrogenedentes bacterium]|nr:hypothetical protein [Candidatus Hydrogenedentota bacterium]
MQFPLRRMLSATLTIGVALSFRGTGQTAPEADAPTITSDSTEAPPEPKSAPSYTNADLDAVYSIHDVFARLDGVGSFRVGMREFDGIDGVSVVETVRAYTDKYQVQPDGRYRFFSDPSATFNGTIGGFGSLVAHSRRAVADEDARIPEGYAGIRNSVLRGSGLTTAKFSGSYSYHALIGLKDLSWRNLFGLAAPDASGHFVLAVSGLTPTNHSVSVASDGKTVIDGNPSPNATLAEDGDLLFQSLDEGPNDDPQFPQGYAGLAIYVRRSAAAALADFTGSYRVHELRVRGDRAQVMGLGSFKAAGNGAYAGSIVRNGVTQDFSGTIKLNASGTFSLSPSATVEGTLSREARYAILTKDGGSVQDGGTGEAWMQIWMRTSGGEPSTTDPDGDGLSNAEEAALGTNPNLADTDHDGLRDGVDPQPLSANNVFTAQPTTLTFSKLQGAPDPPAQTLTIANAANPFFYWSLTANQPWITVSSPGATGGGSVTVSVNTSGFQVSGSPYTGAITVTSPGMANSPLTIPVQVNVTQLLPILSVNPAALEFSGFVGGPQLDQQTVAISNDGVGTLHWTATSLAPWLTAHPASGTGNGSLSVGVNLTGLAASALPYTGVVRIAATGATGSPADVAVTLTVLPARNPGDEFPVAGSAQPQSGPAAAYDSLSGRYAVAWTEDGGINCRILDHEGYPLSETAPVTSGVTGVFAHSTVIANLAVGAFWVIWEKRPNSVSPSDIVGRAVGLAPSNTMGMVFNVSTATASQIQPSGVYNPDRSEIAIAYSSAESGNLDIRLARLNAVSAAQVGAATVAQAAGDEVAPWIAYDNTHHEYLVAYSDSTTGASSAQILAQRVNSATGANVGLPITVSTGSGAHQAPRVAYCADNDTWAVLWQIQTSGGNASDVSLAQFPAGQDAPTITRLTIAGDPGDQLPGGVEFSPDGAQFMALWLDQNPLPHVLTSRRITVGGRELGGVTPFAVGNGNQNTPHLSFNPDDNEFFTVWQDARDGGVQIFAQRTSGGSPDEDGDGLPNDFELQYGLDPFDPTGVNGASGDPDGDGWSNLQEFHAHTNPKNADTDGDGLPDPEEDANGNGILDSGESDPTKADTDSDGFDDGAEHFLGTNPQDPASIPGTAIYRIVYGTWTPDAPGTIKVYVCAVEAGAYTLSLNSPGAPGFVAPTGWTVTPVSATTQTLPIGTTVFTIQATPVSPITPQSAIGAFAFRLTNAAKAIDQTLTAQMVCDARQTLSGGTTVDALALRYAPVFKMHRDEYYAPIPVEFSLAQSQLRVGNGHTLAKSPTPSALFDSPQEESRIDLTGTTTDQLRAAYTSAGGGTNPTVYYTATTLGGESAEPGATASDFVLHYYVHFFADEWGATTAGGHRHEGDWQLVQVLLDASKTPYLLTATEQWQAARDTAAPGGVSIVWANTERLNDTHPAIYVGYGGHSLHFHPGSTRYTPGLEVHDGLGTWYAPGSAKSLQIDTTYPSVTSYSLSRIARAGEANTASWLRYAGRWGQDAFPAAPGDAPTAETRRGPLGPVFMGTASDASSPGGVRSFWIDPWAWAKRAPILSAPSQTTVSGILPASLFGKTVVLSDARGRVFRTTASPVDGAFSLSVPAGVYVLSVVDHDALAHETFLAVVRFALGPPVETLFPTQPSGDTNLGSFTLNGLFLDGSAIYDVTDADADGIPNSSDPDMDNDGVPNTDDPDALGDGWLDTYQRQDSNDNGIPLYYDPARKEEVLTKAAQAPDADGDGFIDAIDEDLDNDGYTNDQEFAAGSNPYLYRDTPAFKVGDIDQDGEYNAIDIQAMINMALGLHAPDLANADFDGDGRITAIDLQGLINRVLGTL